MGEPFEACRELCDGILHHQALDLPQRGKEAEDAEFFNSLPSLLLCSSAAKANVLTVFLTRPSTRLHALRRPSQPA